MRLKNILVILLLTAVTACSTKEKQTIISGKVNNGTKIIGLTQLNPDNIFENKSIEIPVDSTGKFKFELDIKRPTYFYLNGLDIYLRPGDNLLISTDSRRRIVFGGSAAKACNYLKGTPMYKAGSFLKGGIAFDRKEVNSENLIAFTDSCLKQRTDLLNKITNADPYFLKIERNRNSLNAANTILSYGSYEGMRNNWPRAKTNKRVKEIITKYHNNIEKHLSNLNQADNIVLGLCTDLLGTCKEFGFYTKYCPELEEYQLVSDFLYTLKSAGVSESIVKEKNRVMAKVKTPAYTNILNKEWAKFSALEPGKPAPNISFELCNGDKKKLNDYKGKLLVIDVWATWCGPCKKEKPIFAQLANKFKNEPVVFLALSTDNNAKVWKKMIDSHKGEIHYKNGLAESVEAYNINFIPRFIVIDKDFKILNAFAPSPSSGELEALIRCELN